MRGARAGIQEKFVRGRVLKLLINQSKAPDVGFWQGDHKGELVRRENVVWVGNEVLDRYDFGIGDLL